MIDEKKLIEERPESLNELHIKNGEYNKGWNACNKWWLNLIKKQPKAGEWIPVSERLPKENEEILVSTNELNIDFAFYHKGKFIYDHDEFGEIDYWFDDGDEVIAWMPLPKAYEVQDEIEG